MKSKVFNALAALVLIVCYSCNKIDSEHEEAGNVEISVIDFSKLKYGEYNGYYAGGKYGWRENTCLVTIDTIEKDSSVVKKIELISSAEDSPKDFIDELYKRVVDNQTLQVDAVSGSTLSTKTHLKAIEDALLKSVNDKD